MHTITTPNYATPATTIRRQRPFFEGLYLTLPTLFFALLLCALRILERHAAAGPPLPGADFLLSLGDRLTTPFFASILLFTYSNLLYLLFLLPTTRPRYILPHFLLTLLPLALVVFGTDCARHGIE